MEAIKDLILGDPLYDCNGRVIRRNFGIKNIFIILVIVYGLYSLRGKMGIKSGRRKLRGGGGDGDGDGDDPPPEAPKTSTLQTFMFAFLRNIPTLAGLTLTYLMLRSWK